MSSVTIGIKPSAFRQVLREPMPNQNPAEHQRKTLTFLAWFAVLLTSGLFLIRGPLRADSGYVNDFAAPYTATRLWLQHRNPYDSAAFFPTWHAAKAPLGKVPGNPSGTHPIYPPPTLVVLIPFAFLPWPVAVKALTLLSTGLYLAAILFLATFLPGSWRDPIRPAFLAFALVFAPTHSALHVSNVACLASSLLLLAICLFLRSPNTRRTNLVPIACLTLSICIKPTLGLLLLPYFLWTRAWRTLAITIALCLAITAVSLYPLLSLGSAWLTSLRENIAVVFTNGGAADVSEQSNLRFDRIDLQVPLYALLHSRAAASVVATLIAAALLLLWFKSTPTPHDDSLSVIALDHHLLRIATLLAISILPFYQRYYSAMILLIPILWAFRSLSTPAFRRASLWTLALSSVFLINTEAIFARSPLLPALTLRLSFLTNFLVGPHLCWLLFALAILLLATLRQQCASGHDHRKKTQTFSPDEALSVT
jgi:Glycosyltransferase family 87